MKTLDVVGIGSAIVDVLADVDDGFLAQHRIPKGSMQLIDDVTAGNLYSAMPPAMEASGGSAANTIAGVAALGGTAGFIGKVADDQLGRVFAHDLRALGVHFDAEAVRGGAPTAQCLVMVTPDAQRSMCTFLGVSGTLTADDVDPGLIGTARIVYLEGYLFDPPLAREGFFKAARIAHERGGQVAFTLSDPFCVDRHREAMRAFIDRDVDILFANEVEICALVGTNDFDGALQAVRGMCEIAALTRSEKGSVIVAGDEVHVIDAWPVETVVDTTGAGDLYAAGVLTGLARGRDLATCARLGSLAAAEVISHLGARPRADIKALAETAGLL